MTSIEELALVALDNAQIKYSSVQNWYAGDKEGKRGKCLDVNSKITWKYPSVVLMGDNSVGAG